MKKFVLLLLIIFTASSSYAQTNRLEGDWEGYVSIQGIHLIIKTHFQKRNGHYSGKIDIPQQGAFNITLKKIQYLKNDSVYFQFRGGPGIATFEGKMINDSTITGFMYQRSRQFSFKLKRVVTEEVPYNHKDLIIKNDSIKIGGTLTWPADLPTKQLVITISGSGAQTRDEVVAGFKIFATIADYLTRHGIAVFRYDDRGVGKSTGSLGQATLAMLADDVEAIVNYFTAHHDSVPTFSEIILLGHSQGGVVAAEAAEGNTMVDKLILMSSPGISLKRIMLYQAKQTFLRANIDSSLIAKEIASRENLMDAVIHGRNVKKAQQKYKHIFKTVQLVAGLDSAQASALAQRQVQVLTQIFGSPLMQSLLYYNPTTDLQQLDIPVLVLFGGKDTQVPVEMNKAPIKQALEKAGVSYKIKIFPNANHLFQKAKTGKVSEYATLKDEFVDGFLETIVQWIKK